MDEPLVFDASAALERVGHDKVFLRELIGICLDDAKDKLPKIQTAIIEGNFSQIDFLSHSIKSAFGNIGAMKCFALSYELEKKGKSSIIEGAETLYANLLSEIERFKFEYQSVLALVDG